MKRTGRRNRPFFRVVVLDQRAPQGGSPIEELGWYNPIAERETYSINTERMIHWLKLGAQPTDTVRTLLRKSGIALRWHMLRQGMDERQVNIELQKWALDQEAGRKKSLEGTGRGRAAAEKPASEIPPAAA